jgi:hypothetical protein
MDMGDSPGIPVAAITDTDANMAIIAIITINSHINIIRIKGSPMGTGKTTSEHPLPVPSQAGAVHRSARVGPVSDRIVGMNRYVR